MPSPAGSSRSREATTTPRASQVRPSDPRTPIALSDEIDWNLFDLILDREDKAHQRRKSQGTPGVGLSTHTTPRARRATATPRGSAGKASAAETTPRAHARPLVANSDDEEADPDDSLLSVNSSQLEGLSSDSLPSATGSQFDTSPPIRRVIPTLSSVEEDSLPDPYGSQFEQSRPTRQTYTRAYRPTSGDIREESQISHESFDESMESDGLPDPNDSQFEQSRPVLPYRPAAEAILEEEGDETHDSDSDSLPDPDGSQFHRTPVSRFPRTSRGDSAEMSAAEHLLGEEGDLLDLKEGSPPTFRSQKSSQEKSPLEQPRAINPPVSVDVPIDAEEHPTSQVPISSQVPQPTAVPISREVPITPEEPDAPEVSVFAEVPITAVAATAVTHLVIGRAAVVAAQEDVQQDRAPAPSAAEQPVIPEDPAPSAALAPVAAARAPSATTPSSSAVRPPFSAVAPIPAVAQVFPVKARRAPDDPNEFAPPDDADMTDAERRGDVPAVAKPVSPLRGPRKPRKEKTQKTPLENLAAQAREENVPEIVEPEGLVDDEPLFELDARRPESPEIDPELMCELIVDRDNDHEPPVVDGIAPALADAPELNDAPPDVFDRQVAFLQDPASAPLQPARPPGRAPSPPPVDPYMFDEDGKPFAPDGSMEELIPPKYVAPESRYHGRIEGNVSRYSRLVGGRTRRWTPVESLLLWRTVQQVPMGIDNPITIVSYLHGEFGIRSHMLAFYNNQHMRNRMRQICETRSSRKLPIEGRARMFLPPKDPRRQAYIEDKETFREAELEEMERKFEEENKAKQEESRQKERRKRRKLAEENEDDDEEVEEYRSEEGRDYPEMGYAASDEEYVAPPMKRRQIEGGPSMKRRLIEADPSTRRLQTKPGPSRRPHIAAPPARKRRHSSDEEEDELDSSPLPSPTQTQHRAIKRYPSPQRRPIKPAPAPRAAPSHRHSSPSDHMASSEDGQGPRYYRRRRQDFDHVPAFNIEDLDESSSEDEPSQSSSPRLVPADQPLDDQEDELEDYESEEGEGGFNDDVVVPYDDAPLHEEGAENANAPATEDEHQPAMDDEQPPNEDPSPNPSPGIPAAPAPPRSARRVTVLAIEPPTLPESQRRRYTTGTVSPVATRHVPVTRRQERRSRVGSPRQRGREPRAASAALNEVGDGGVEETLAETMESVEEKGPSFESYVPSDDDDEHEIGPSKQPVQRPRTRARSANDDQSYDDEEDEARVKPTVWGGRTRASGAHELEPPRATRSGLRWETLASADKGKQPAQAPRRNTRAAARAASAALEEDVSVNVAEVMVKVEEDASEYEEGQEDERQDEEMVDELDEEMIDELDDERVEAEALETPEDELDDDTAESDARAVRRAMIRRAVMGSPQ